MSFEDVIFWLRIINAVLASFIFAALIATGRLNWKVLDPARRAGYVAFSLYALATAYYSIETYAMHVQPGGRSFIFFAANVATLYALWKYRQLFGHHKDE